MKIAVIGTGYVGLTAGACFANLGNQVVCADQDKEKVALLQKGEVPIFEPGLAEMVRMNVKEHRLSFTSSTKEAVQSADIVFIAVGTPSMEDGSVDMRYVEAVAKDIGQALNGYKVIVDKSTVPVGTAGRVKDIIREQSKGMFPFDMVSNPEFLRQGAALKDFQVFDRVVIGTESEKAKGIMHHLYKDLERTNHPVLFTDIKSAEIIKYASNAMLATRISFMNELSQLCERMGGDIKVVAEGMGLDTRIGSRFLQAGIGYGGSCFPKDVKALSAMLRGHGCPSRIVDAVEAVNHDQKASIVKKLLAVMPDLRGKRIAIWGLAFKPKTDDLREAPSIVVITTLLEKGAKVVAFDPVAEANAKKLFSQIAYTDTPQEAIKGADALLIVTEWDEFRQLDKQEMMSLMKTPVVIDGRNIYDPQEMQEAGFTYVCVGRQVL
ncbi:MAG: UDP-glucose/GDP-mannose dehydrogenase family protein [Nanoarchaeota archaeon]